MTVTSLLGVIHLLLLMETLAMKTRNVAKIMDLRTGLVLSVNKKLIDAK